MLEIAYIALPPLEETPALWTWVFLQSRRNKPDRADITDMEFPRIDGGKGAIFSFGKLPAWAFAPLLSHYRNLCPWQAVYDPTLKGAIVINSTDRMFPVGFLIDARLPCLACADEDRIELIKAGAIYPYCRKHQNHAPERQSYPKSDS
ncbi:MAG TPA: CRISPR-associated protein Csx3 [Leptolyngbyaceae cyanobacterium]